VRNRREGTIIASAIQELFTYFRRKGELVWLCLMRDAVKHLFTFTFDKFIEDCVGNALAFGTATKDIGNYTGVDIETFADGEQNTEVRSPGAELVTKVVGDLQKSGREFVYSGWLIPFLTKKNIRLTA
jgi:hypothetical protein